MVTGAEQERAHLGKADQHIAVGEKHVTEQEMRIARLRAHGHDVTKFEAMLATLRKSLVVQDQHRKLILQRIAQYDSK